VSKFDEYFDMVYYVNLESRPDRNENILDLFRKLGINKFIRIDAIKSEEINLNDIKVIKRNPLTKMSNTKFSKAQKACLESHKLCYYHALSNRYEKIMIFEDDACIRNGVDLKYHLDNCFKWLKNNEWDIFYFDDNKSMKIDHSNNSPQEIIRMSKPTDEVKRVNFSSFGMSLEEIYDFDVPYKKVKYQTHSYAINCDFLEKHINFIHNTGFNNDHSLILNPYTDKKFYYTTGLFDQILGMKSDNNWNSFSVPSFIIIGEPRSGTTNLSRFLDQLPCVDFWNNGTYEILNYNRKVKDPKKEVEEWYDNIKDGNIKGCKILFIKDQYFDGLVDLINSKNISVIFISRSDKINQMISHFYASSIKIWHNDPDNNVKKIGKKVNINVKDHKWIKQNYKTISVNQKHFLRNINAPVLHLDYEEVVTINGKRRVLEFLNIELPENYESFINEEPMLVDRDYSKVIENYDELYSDIKKFLFG